MQHVVIGAGEVGRAVHEVLAPYDPILRDLDGHVGLGDVLHICFPWSDVFEANVEAYTRYYDPRLVIIHSTVPRGTCDPHGWVHSPVTGRHPDLVESVRTFTKYFGGLHAEAAAPIFAAVGVRVRTTRWAATTEAGKLWELVQYGLAIVVEKQLHAYCEYHGIAFDVAYTDMARSYNEGYDMLGLGQFTRPVLEHMPGPIGGHCVLPGADMLDHWVGALVNGLGGGRNQPALAEEVVA